MKIAFLINSMRRGGAEGVLSQILENISRKDREIILICLEDYVSFSLPKDVKGMSLFKKLDNNFLKFLAVFWGAWKLKKVIDRENIGLVVSFMERSNFTNVLAKIFRTKHKVIISERTNIELAYPKNSLKFFFNKILIKKLYNKSDLIICNSLGVGKILEKFFIPKGKIKIIYNPVNLEEIKEKTEENGFSLPNLPKIIAVGRLIEAKGQKFLIKAFVQVCKKMPSVLIILGSGRLEKDLKNQAINLGIEKQILFLGWQSNPYKFLAKCDIFVLSSLWEGFPNVLLEAMACGLPVVSTNCRFGPSEIIKDGQNGLLVPVKDEGALAEAILKMLNNRELREKFSEEGKETVQKFSSKRSIQEYENLFKEVLK